MDFNAAIAKLSELQSVYHALFCTNHSMDAAEYQRLHDQTTTLYGELEEVINRFGGLQKIEVAAYRGQKCIFNNYIEATVMTGGTIVADQGYQLIVKLIGKLRQQAVDPAIPQLQASVTQVVEILRRFRECCQYVKEPPQDEPGVQDIMWIMLRSQFERVEREATLRPFGAKAYKPDFGLPDVRLLVEAKFIGLKTSVSEIQETILADIPGYINDNSQYDAIVVLVYDAAQKLRDPSRFIKDVRSVDGIVDVIVIPGIG